MSECGLNIIHDPFMWLLQIIFLHGFPINSGGFTSLVGDVFILQRLHPPSFVVHFYTGCMGTRRAKSESGPEIPTAASFQEIELFDMARPAEFEANIFAAEVLISDDEVLELLNDEYKSFFGVARELYVPAPLLDFKFRVLKHKGYRIEPPLIATIALL